MSRNLAGLTLSSRLLSTVEDRAIIGSTTGAPTAGTGKHGRPLLTWTGNGTFTVERAGWARLLVASGGRSGGGASTTNSGSGGEAIDVCMWLEVGVYTVTVGTGGTYPYGNGGASSVTKANVMSIRAKAPSTQNTGNADLNTTAVGIASDITGERVGFGGAGWSTTNAATFDALFGGAQAGALARANSGGGGNEVGSGAGAAGVVMLLT